MKKHVYSLLMVMAIIGLARTTAWAQAGDGLTVSTALEQAVGSTTTFSFLQTGANITWTVLQADDGTYAPGGATAAAASGTHFNWVTDATGGTVDGDGFTDEATAYVKWLSAPTAGNTIYIVRMEETTGDGCSTIREVYLSIFDFTFDVFLSDASGNSIEGTAATTICNTWDGTLVANEQVAPRPVVASYQGAEITTNHADYSNNPTDDDVKLTPTYFTVSIEITSGAVDFNSLSCRLQYSLPTQTALNLYSIEAETGVLFNSTAGSELIQAGAATGDLTVAALAAGNYANNNTFYIPGRTDGVGSGVQSVEYTFEVLTHNNLGQADMLWGVRIDKLDLDFVTENLGEYGTTFGNGTKINNAVTATYTADTPLAAGVAVSEDMTVQQSPATPIITIGY